MAIAFPPVPSIALTTDEAAPASFAYVIATLAPSAARRFAMAAPIPREPPVTSATFLVNLDIGLSFALCDALITIELTQQLLLARICGLRFKEHDTSRRFDVPASETDAILFTQTAGATLRKNCAVPLPYDF